MTCDNFRELISASLDAELASSDEARLGHHISTCASCHHYQEDAFALQRSMRMRIVSPVQAGPAPAPVAVAGSLRGVSFLRWALFVIGGTLVILNVQSIVFAESSAAAHLSRHDGVFGTALGIGMLAVAAKPHRAIGLVPLTSAIAILMVAVAIADLASGQATMLAEAVHLVQFAGLVCLWGISGGATRMQRRFDAAGSWIAGRRTGSVHEWPIA